jgi:hypothetical protein
MEKIGIGRTAEVFRDDDGTAIKFFFDWLPETEAAHEAAILRSVSQVCGLAPKFHELVRMDGRCGLRFEFIGGGMAAQRMFAKPLQAFGLARAIGRLHREVHSAHAFDLRTAEEVYGPGLREYTGMDEAARSGLLDFLRRRQGDSLCHGDFHPENVLIDEAGQMRVIDWVNAYSGDPLSDAARTYYLMRYGRSPNKRTVLESLLEKTVKPLLAGAYLRGFFGGRKYPASDFRQWLLIVMINRHVRERIAEEERDLKRAISRILRSVRAWS